MPSASKTGVASKDRRKSDKVENNAGAQKIENKPGSIIIKLTIATEKLQRIILGEDAVEENTPVKDNESPAPSTTVPAPLPSSSENAENAENASDTTPNTPTASGTPAPTPAMGPPVDGPKKKGVKRSAAGANGNGSDAPAKVRGKPGPKKKARLDDGTLEPGRANGLGHKLGPKANQGAINAGLRALDRSGKPCRKWAKGGFRVKSFTGVVWEIPRWTAPPRPQPEAVAPPQEPVMATTSAEGGSKENKENDQQQIKSENSNSGADVEMQSTPSLPANSPAPAPLPIPAAS